MFRLMILVLTTLLAVSTAQAQKTYRWVDEKGVTHFSTRPPPGLKTDQTRLKGGTVTQPRPSTEADDLAKIKSVDLQRSGWEGCSSNLCQLTKQLDPECKTSYCSRAKRYTESCGSATCQTKKIAFEKDVQERIALRNQNREQQAINANTVPTPPTSQGRN
ncbi:MAG: DUF4124 domain-containing protein [Gammaproteobacteria bacterium]|nr:DUF4124 domain-containing protein [Gammaproteobacteria bacterium]NIM74189.1 DUF4124 domain-containing protein [Gammaproteobacteria bacterium]NIO25961.1 DUF4124 domain-containing protein [Gammaproteobacteria bacterium]NIO66594.1 DUF4124 domain-containing protein [Gammaproteobacteria bacterium]NIP46199.1 DUF4124 domain-containing protein [Gammaproteobacteria bacterium]